MSPRLLLLVLSSCWGCMRPSEPNSNPPKSKALWTGDEPTDGSGWAKCNIESKCTASIQALVHADYDQIRECYMAGVARHKSLCGEAHIKFTIDETGRVQRPQAIVGTTLPDCDVVKCIEGRFSQLQFPSPEGGSVTVVYPLRFVP